MGEDPTRRRFLGSTAAGIGASMAGCAVLERVVDRDGGSTDGSDLGPAAIPDDGPRWPMFQFDARHSGTSAATGPLGAVTERWTALSDVRMNASPAVASGTVFVGGGEHLYAIDAEDGTVHWRVHTDGQVTSTPAVGHGMVYVPGETIVSAVDGHGEVQWRRRFASRIMTDPVITQDGVLVAADAVLQALEPTGEKRWSFEQTFDEPPERESMTTPAVDHDRGAVYVGGNFEYGEKARFRHGRMYAVDPADGTELWQFEGEDNVSTPTVGDGLVYFGTRYGTLEALVPDTGEREWRLDVGGDVASSPAIVDGRLYVAADAIYAVDAASGEVQWQFDLPEASLWSNSSPAVADGVVYVGSGVLGREGRLYALDADGGEVRWQREYDAPVFTSPAVVDGSLFVGDDRLRAFTGTE